MAATGARKSPLRVELREPDDRLRETIREALLAAGADVLTLNRGNPDVLMWSVVTNREMERLERTHPSTQVLALVDNPSAVLVDALLGAGARSVLDRAADPAILARGAVAVARGYVVLPSESGSAALEAMRLRAVDS